MGIEAILPYLDARNWLLVRSTSNSGPFITTDNPVNLSWKEPDKIPPFYRASPGYGLKGTQVYFPVSKNVALVGEFDGPKDIIDGSKELIAALNSKMLLFTYKQVYSPTLNFYFMSKDNVILSAGDEKFGFIVIVKELEFLATVLAVLKFVNEDKTFALDIEPSKSLDVFLKEGQYFGIFKI